MTLQNIAMDVNALVTTNAASPPNFTLKNFQELADAINAGGTVVAPTEAVNAVTVAAYAAATVPVVLAAARATRKALIIHNPSANPLRVAFAATAGAPVHIVVSALGTLTLNASTFPYRGGVWGLSHNTTGYQVIVGEIY